MFARSLKLPTVEGLWEEWMLPTHSRKPLAAAQVWTSLPRQEVGKTGKWEVFSSYAGFLPACRRVLSP
jgi:hypothetical protein